MYPQTAYAKEKDKLLEKEKDDIYMNEYALLHMPESNYCFPTGKKQITLRLRTAKEDNLEQVAVIHACKYEFHNHRIETKMEKKYNDRLFSYYEVILDIEDVRFAYIFRLVKDGVTKYYCEDGLVETYNFNLGFYNFFQLPYISEEDRIETVEWMKSAVFYQIFVDRFFQGDKEKDESYINSKWDDMPTPKSFSGGDLKGILNKLDYIASLGVNVIYLTPIFVSGSNHKYDISDYKRIDPGFGSNEDFKILVEAIHTRGMKIVLDAVFNHCSSSLLQFQDVMKRGKQSPYHSWFIIDGDKPDPQTLNYECFGSCHYMPKLNSANVEVRDFLLDIGCHWVEEYDIDGWRLDVSDEVSHDFWRVFRKEIKDRKKDCVIIGENWHNAYPFLMGDQYDGIMNYAFTKASLDYFAFDSLDTQHFAWKLNEILMRNKTQVNLMMMNLLDSHDTHRFFTEVSRDKNKLLAAIAIMTVFPGAPCIYYGTEICTEGGYDPDSRRTFNWEEKDWDKEVWKTIHRILRLKDEKTLQEGDISITAKEGLLYLERKTTEETICFIYNGENLEAVIGTGQEIILAHRYEADRLKQGGFVVTRC